MLKELVSELRGVIQPYIEERGFELVDFIVYKNKNNLMMRILADRQNGSITIDECAQLNNDIGEMLDKENILDTSYLLEVSSPGLDRPLKTIKDYRRNIGRKIRVFTNIAINEKYELIGELFKAQDDSIDINTDRGQINIRLVDIKLTKQVI